MSIISNNQAAVKERGIGVAEAFVPLKRDHNGIALLSTDNPFADDFADMDDERADNKHDWRGDEENN